MSADIIAFCPTCKVEIHLGQSSGAGASFGYGWNDFSGQKLVAEFVAKHVYCDLEHGIRCVLSDHGPDDCEEVDYWPERGSQTKNQADRMLVRVVEELFPIDALASEETETIYEAMEQYAADLDEWGHQNLTPELLVMNSHIVQTARQIAELVRTRGKGKP